MPAANIPDCLASDALGNGRLARLQSGLRKVISQLSSLVAENSVPTTLIRHFCSAANELLGTDSTCYWQVRENELVAVEEQGNLAENWAGKRISLGGEEPAAEAARKQEPLFRNQEAGDRPPGAASLRASMALPLVVGDELWGVMVMSKDGRDRYFDDVSVAKAAALLAVLANSLESVCPNPPLRARNPRSEAPEQFAEDLTAIALELNSSFQLPLFAKKFTQRAAEMMQARAAILALAQGSNLEIAVLHEPVSEARDGLLLHRLNVALLALATRQTETVRTGKATELLGEELAAALGWETLTVSRMEGTGSKLLGLLCLADPASEWAAPGRKLLPALVSHASVALENARLFIRMDQANRHWMEVFDAITDFIVVHDQKNKVLRVNRTFADSIGLSPAQLIGVSMRALVSMTPETTGLQPCPFCRIGIDEYVDPVLERTYLLSTSRIHGAVTEDLQTIHVLKDITDRREAERRYREIFDNIQEGLFFSSPDGRFVEVNDALVRMLGYDSREELLQIDIPSRLYLTPGSRQRLETAIAKSAGVVRNFEEVLRRKDGSIIHCLQNVFAVKDKQGRVLQFRGLILDITELKTFQAELQRERDFSSKILNHTQSLILVVDTAGLISYANRRCYQVGNYKESDLVGRKVVDLVLPQSRELMARTVELCLLGQQVDNLELPIMVGGGHSGRFSVNLSPMRDEQGAVNSIVVVMTDITDAALLQAKLVHTEKMAAVGQLVSGVAHEVNNPLTAVLGFTDLLLENPDVPEPVKSDLSIILQEAQRTKQIVQNLLSFARQMPPLRTNVSVNAILQRTLALRSYDLANRHIEIVERYDADLPEIVGDAHQLQQVFLNILNNAYDAVCEADHPGQIEISTTLRDDFTEIAFRDNGTGIRNPERIFDPFFTTKEVGKGTGLGLSICYGIVHEHGGDISCRNNSDGPGATFMVRLPLKEKACSTAGGHS